MEMEPITRREMFMAKAGGQDVRTPSPITREEMFLSKIGSSGAGTQADWNQNDPTAPEYVKNRPFWTGGLKDTVLFNGTVKSSGKFPFEMGLGVKYTVTLDGIEYSLTAQEDANGYVFIGSETLWNGDDYIDTEPPFYIGGDWCEIVNVGDTHKLKISTELTEVHKIDSKYLPGLVKTFDNTNAIFINLDVIEFGGQWFGEGTYTVSMEPERWEALRSCANNRNIMVTGTEPAMYGIYYDFPTDEISMLKKATNIYGSKVYFSQFRKSLAYDAEQQMCTCTFSDESISIEQI